MGLKQHQAPAAPHDCADIVAYLAHLRSKCIRSTYSSTQTLCQSTKVTDGSEKQLTIIIIIIIDWDKSLHRDLQIFLYTLIDWIWFMSYIMFISWADAAKADNLRWFLSYCLWNTPVDMDKMETQCILWRNIPLNAEALILIRSLCLQWRKWCGSFLMGCKARSLLAVFQPDLFFYTSPLSHSSVILRLQIKHLMKINFLTDICFSLYV